MKNLILTLLLLTGISTQAKTFNQQKLQANLNAIGITMEEAQKAFENADPNLGTLAICGKLSWDFLVGNSFMLCTTVSDLYEVSTPELGIAANAALTVNLIYFRTEDPDFYKHCFVGGHLAAGFELQLGLQGAREIDCKDENSIFSKNTYKNGFLIGVEGGAGMGLVASKAEITIQRIERH